MLGRKRGAERTRRLAKQFEMPPALPTTNLHGGPRQLREKGARRGGKAASGSSSRASGRSHLATGAEGWRDGRKRLPHAEFSLPVPGRDGTGRRRGRLPGDPHPRGGRLRAAGAARLNCAHWALPWPATGRAARLPRRRGFGAGGRYEAARR